MNGYFAAYTRDFSGGKTRKAWEEERRARILGKRSISVVLTDFDIEVKGDRATVGFRAGLPRRHPEGVEPQATGHGPRVRPVADPEGKLRLVIRSWAAWRHGALLAAGRWAAGLACRGGARPAPTSPEARLIQVYTPGAGRPHRARRSRRPEALTREVPNLLSASSSTATCCWPPEAPRRRLRGHPPARHASRWPSCAARPTSGWPPSRERPPSGAVPSRVPGAAAAQPPRHRRGRPVAPVPVRKQPPRPEAGRRPLRVGKPPRHGKARPRRPAHAGSAVYFITSNLDPKSLQRLLRLGRAAASTTRTSYDVRRARAARHGIWLHGVPPARTTRARR